ncbi:serine hydrolase domain-containing protein [Luteimonas sp. SDU101]|uniref:serine hydrolase domain-containing protein n=1 Tax=Luteimonas sp. SDU101 TaxID=3422593 RepID=UPI003EBC7C9E
MSHARQPSTPSWPAAWPRHALAWLVSALAACTTTGESHMAPQPHAQVEAMMAAYAEEGGPGAALLVLHDGAPVLRAAYGLADLEQDRPVTPATAFRLASVSKQFTAAAILLLAQDGTLSIDDPLRRWLPSLPAATEGITLHHLLTHTSGLVDYEDLPPEPLDGQVQDADVLRLLEAVDRLDFAPGSRYRYSNSGYVLLGLVVARASGRPFPEFLRERIFDPLGMHAVARVDGGPPVPQRAYGYSQRDGRWVRTDQGPTSATLGDGGIYASIDDLAKWDAALDDDRLLTAASRALAFAAHAATGEPDVDAYGYGWRLHASDRGPLQWHSGESIGFRNVILRWPEQALTVVLLSNRNDPEPYALARRIAAAYMPGPPQR